MKINWFALFLSVLCGVLGGYTGVLEFVGGVIGAYIVFVLIANKFFTKAETDNDKVNTDTITRDD